MNVNSPRRTVVHSGFSMLQNGTMRLCTGWNCTDISCFDACSVFPL